MYLLFFHGIIHDLLPFPEGFNQLANQPLPTAFSQMSTGFKCLADATGSGEKFKYLHTMKSSVLFLKNLSRQVSQTNSPLISYRYSS